MAESEQSTSSNYAQRKRKNKGRYCVTGYPNKRSCKNTSYTPGIRMYKLPDDPQLRTQWTKFVQRHRPDFQTPPPGKNVALYSAHFKEECFTKPRLSLEGMEHLSFRRMLIPGSIPTEDAVTDEEQAMSSREQRHVRTVICETYFIFSNWL